MIYIKIFFFLTIFSIIYRKLVFVNIYVCSSVAAKNSISLII
nr:MAG TPA: hypothetical protein [Caudoviricetes sp.]